MSKISDDEKNGVGHIADAGKMVLVPVEPTREMWAAAANEVCDLQSRGIGHHDIISEAVYTAMLSSAPQPANTDLSLRAKNERLRNMVDGYGKLDAEYALAERRAPIEITEDAERVIDAVMEAERFAPKAIPMGANPPLFDGMQPDNDGPWLNRVDVAKRLRAALQGETK